MATAPSPGCCSWPRCRRQGAGPGLRPWRWRLAPARPACSCGRAPRRGRASRRRRAARRRLLRPRPDPVDLLPHPVAGGRDLRPVARLAGGPERRLELPASSGGLGDPAVLRSGAFLACMLARRRGCSGGGARRRDRPARPTAGPRPTAWPGSSSSSPPTSSFLPIADVLVEHRVYLASWGLFLARRPGRESPARPRGSRAADLVAVLVVGAGLGLLAVALHRRNAVWEGALVFWRDVVDKSPGKARPRLGLGVARLRSGDLAGADGGVPGRHRPRVPPDAAALRVSLLHNLGGTRSGWGEPRRPWTRCGRRCNSTRRRPDPRESLALALWLTGDLDGAEAEARARPRPVSRRRRGRPGAGPGAHGARNDDAGAVRSLEQAVRARPSDAGVRYDLGAAYANLGRVAEACASWRAVLQLPAAGESREAARGAWRSSNARRDGLRARLNPGRPPAARRSSPARARGSTRWVAFR